MLYTFTLFFTKGPWVSHVPLLDIIYEIIVLEHLASEDTLNSVSAYA